MFDPLGDLSACMRELRKFWLAPVPIPLVLLGALPAAGQGSAVAPSVCAAL